MLQMPATAAMRVPRPSKRHTEAGVSTHMARWKLSFEEKPGTAGNLSASEGVQIFCTA